jgi:hypothetical protein
VAVPTAAVAGTASGADVVAGVAPGRLTVSGTQILTPDGQPIVLRGFNWGQWGTAQPEDAASNVAQGANSVRIPLRWWGKWKAGTDSYDKNAPGHIDPAHLKLLDKTIGWATSHQLWVILFADSNRGQGAQGKDNFWNDPTMRAQFAQMWKFLAHRYANTPCIAAYELLAEPRPPGVSDADVRSFYSSLIKVVRPQAPTTPVVVGPNDGYDLHQLNGAYLPGASNVIYTGDYFIFSHPLARMKFIASFEQKDNAPVWINQVGIPSGRADSKAKARTVLNAFDQKGTGWAWWTYRDLGTSPSGEGIYYQDPAHPGQWILKKDWLTLVSSYLRLAGRRASTPVRVSRRMGTPCFSPGASAGGGPAR